MSSDSITEILSFSSRKDWERWLARSHAKASGIWLRFFRTGSGVASITHPEALTAALCYGWIDGQLKKDGDPESWLQRFTPRRPRSLWSKRNRELVEQLTAVGKMKPAGEKEVAAAKADGRWDRAYDSPREMTIPPDFLSEVARSPEAQALFATLNKANLYAIAWRLQTAKKPETRAKRIQAIVAMLAEGKKFHN